MTEHNNKPSRAELGVIARDAMDDAASPDRTDANCPYDHNEPARRSRWLRVFRFWRRIMRSPQ